MTALTCLRDTSSPTASATALRISDFVRGFLVGVVAMFGISFEDARRTLCGRRRQRRARLGPNQRPPSRIRGGGSTARRARERTPGAGGGASNAACLSAPLEFTEGKSNAHGLTKMICVAG